MKNVTIRQLHIFSVAARHLSFVRASEEIFLTQPAVSMQIRQLEEIVGLPLFDKIGRKMHLTEAGHEVARTAHIILGALKDADANIDALKGFRSGIVSVNLVSTAKYFVPRFMALFHKTHADIKLQINVGNRETLVRQLHSNEIDLAIMGRPPERIDTLSYPFARHPHVVIAAPDHPFARRSRIPLQDLADEIFLVREHGSGTRTAMENFFHEHGIDPPLGMTMESNETIKQAVMAGLGLGFISLHTIALELKTRQLVVLDVKDTPVMRTWHVVHLRSKRLSPATAAFKDFMLREAGPYLDSTFADTPVHIRNKLTRGERQPISGITGRIASSN